MSFTIPEYFKEDILEFSDCLELINYRQGTIDSYLKSIIVCMEWLKESYGISLSEANTKQLRRFLLHLKKDRELAPRTINIYNCSIKRYFAYVLQRPLLETELPAMRVDRKLPSVPSKEDTFLIIKGTRNPKYRMIFSLTFACALRIGEVVSLRYSDIDLKAGTLHIRESASKNRSEGYVDLPERIRPLWEEYKASYGNECTGEDYIFPGQKQGEHISKSSVAAVLKKRLTELGLQDRGYSMHSFRHAAALFYYQAGADLFQVKTFLRHKSISATLVYVELDGKLKERRHIENPFDDPCFEI